MANWKKENSSRGSESYRLKVGVVRLDVFNGHIHYPGDWLLNCHALSLLNKKLDVENSDEAKKKAVEIVKNKLYAIAGELDHG